MDMLSHLGYKFRMKKPKRKYGKIRFDEEVELTPDSKTKINWFPGHMLKAMRKIKERLKMVDIVLEVRDARSPLASGNQSLKSIIGEKSRLIVINKKNLADPKIVKQWEAWFEKIGEDFIFINSLDKNSISGITKKSREIIDRKIKVSNPDHDGKQKIKMMVIGLPNTGKSTIINRLANRNASKVANKPGQTQSQLWVAASDDIYILDTPGVMNANIVNHEQGLWLSALHAIPDKIAGSDAIALFIIDYLIKTNPKALESLYKLDNAPVDVMQTLDDIAVKRGCFLKKNELDYDRAYTIIIGDLRRGELGLISFGIPPKLTT
jgi:ribosome biogenesis GTPase A